MDQMIRIMVFDHQGTYISDIDPTQVLDMTYVEEVNGEHSLTITTFQTLSKTDRLLIRDGMGVWREFVVLGTEESHTGLYVTNEYYCIWSLQYDLMATFVNNLTGCGYVPGHESVPKAATVALGVALEGTDRWTVGTVTVPTLSSSSFYRRSGWEALQTVVEKWGGEVQATITVSTNGVVSRAVDLLTHVGTSEATRRFDYGHDITSIKRTVSDDVWPCRIVPLGKSMETENGGYTRRPDISSVNGGVMWLQNDAVVPYTRIPDGSGGWEYPTLIIMNESYEEPADVKAWGLENLADLTSPKVTYEADVAQFVRAGLDPHGVALGDNIVVVDRTFGSDGLRLTARVTKITGNLLDASQTKLTIGNIGTSISRQLAGVSREVARLSGDVENASAYQATSEYMDALLGRINQEVNATGGYTYITQGEGIRTYDVPVSDPLVGDEASKVVEVKGGNIRIADSKDSAGNWEWRTVIQSGYIAADVLNASNIQTGTITSYDGDSFWDLDTGVFERNLLWEPIVTDATITTSSSSSLTRGTHATTIYPGKRYAVFFTSAEMTQNNLNVYLADGSNFRYTTSYMQRLSRSETGAYRYVSISDFNGDRNTTMSVCCATRRDSSSSQYPVYHLSDIRVYEWPVQGDGTIGFNIHSQDNTDALTMMLSGGGLRLAFNDNITTLMPGELSLNSIGGTDSTIKLNPDYTGIGAIGFDTYAKKLLLGTTANNTSGGLGIAIGNDKILANGKLTVRGDELAWGIRTTSVDDVFSSTGSSVSSMRAGTVRWGPLIYLYIDGSISGTFNFTDRYCGSSLTIGTFKSDFKPLHNFFGNGQTYTYSDITGHFSNGTNVSGSATFLVNYESIRLQCLTVQTSTIPTSLSSINFRMEMLYMPGQQYSDYQ